MVAKAPKCIDLGSQLDITWLCVNYRVRIHDCQQALALFLDL